jgi:hypothetical protein
MLSAQNKKKVTALGAVRPAIERPQDLEQGAHRLAADVGLDAEPAASHDRPQHGRKVGAGGAERGAGQHREGDPIPGAGM